MKLVLRKNLVNGGISQYSGYTVDGSVVLVGDKKYGLTPDGLCTLDCEHDNGTQINAVVQFGTPALIRGEKRLRSIHVSGQFETVESIKVAYGFDTHEPTATAPVAITSRVGSSGDGDLKFSCSRSEHGDNACIEVTNNQGEGFDIRSIDVSLIRGPRK